MRKMTLDHELKALNAKNNSGSQMRRTTLGQSLRLRVLNVKNDYRSEIRITTQGHE